MGDLSCLGETEIAHGRVVAHMCISSRSSLQEFNESKILKEHNNRVNLLSCSSICSNCSFTFRAHHPLNNLHLGTQ